MAFGFLKKIVKGVGKVAKVATGVASIVPGLNLPSAAARLGLGAIGKIGGRGASTTASKVFQVIQARRAGVTMPVLQATPGLLNRQSAVMPGGAVLSSNGGARAGGTRRRKTRRAGKRAQARRSRGRRGRRGLSAAQLRAGFGGKRRMRRR